MRSRAAYRSILIRAGVLPKRWEHEPGMYRLASEPVLLYRLLLESISWPLRNHRLPAGSAGRCSATPPFRGVVAPQPSLVQSKSLRAYIGRIVPTMLITSTGGC